MEAGKLIIVVKLQLSYHVVKYNNDQEQTKASELKQS